LLDAPHRAGRADLRPELCRLRPSGSDVGLGLWLAYWASDLVRAATGLWSDSSLILARALALPVHWGAGAAGRGAGDEVAAVELASGGVAQELLVQSSKERSPPIEANPPEEQEQP
jgi:hypothetical protein